MHSTASQQKGSHFHKLVHVGILQVQRVQLDIALFNSAISAAAKAGEWELAFALFRSLPKQVLFVQHKACTGEDECIRP